MLRFDGAERGFDEMPRMSLAFATLRRSQVPVLRSGHDVGG